MYRILTSSQFLRKMHGKDAYNTFQEALRHHFHHNAQDFKISRNSSILKKLNFLGVLVDKVVKQINVLDARLPHDPAGHTELLDLLFHFQFAMIMVGIEHALLNNEIRTLDTQLTRVVDAHSDAPQTSWINFRSQQAIVNKQVNTTIQEDNAKLELLRAQVDTIQRTITKFKKELDAIKEQKIHGPSTNIYCQSLKIVKAFDAITEGGNLLSPTDLFGAVLLSKKYKGLAEVIVELLRTSLSANHLTNEKSLFKSSLISELPQLMPKSVNDNYSQPEYAKVLFAYVLNLMIFAILVEEHTPHGFFLGLDITSWKDQLNLIDCIPQFFESHIPSQEPRIDNITHTSSIAHLKIYLKTVWIPNYFERIELVSSAPISTITAEPITVSAFECDKIQRMKYGLYNPFLMSRYSLQDSSSKKTCFSFEPLPINKQNIEEVIKVFSSTCDDVLKAMDAIKANSLDIFNSPCNHALFLDNVIQLQWSALCLALIRAEPLFACSSQEAVINPNGKLMKKNVANLRYINKKLNDALTKLQMPSNTFSQEVMNIIEFVKNILSTDILKDIIYNSTLTTSSYYIPQLIKVVCDPAKTQDTRGLYFPQLLLRKQYEASLLSLENSRFLKERKFPHQITAYYLNLMLLSATIHSAGRTSFLGLPVSSWSAMLRLICLEINDFFSGTAHLPNKEKAIGFLAEKLHYPLLSQAPMIEGRRTPSPPLFSPQPTAGLPSATTMPAEMTSQQSSEDELSEDDWSDSDDDRESANLTIRPKVQPRPFSGYFNITFDQGMHRSASLYLSRGEQATLVTPSRPASPVAGSATTTRAIITYKVLYEFTASEINQFSVNEGELVTSTSIEENGWLWVQKQTGEQGYVPFSYLDPS